MLARIAELFMSHRPAVEADTDTAERVRLATCALMVEIARSDGEFSNEEREHVIETLRRRYALTQDDARELLDGAEAASGSSSDIWAFTNRVNQACNNEEKRRILEELWRVVFADGTLDEHEDYLIHKLARLLNLDHPTLIRAKLAARTSAPPVAEPPDA